MSEQRARDPVRGHTIRWTFTEGTVAGQSYLHTFDTEGTVTYRSADGKPDEDSGHTARYGSAKISDDVYVVSYLSEGGFTLTVVLNFANDRLIAFASNDKQWFQQQGKFELVD